MNDALFHGELVNTNRIIYTPSSFAASALFYIQEIGQLQAQKPHSSQRQNLSSYLFLMVEEGTGTLVYQQRKYDLHPGDCAFIDCNHLYKHETSNRLWTLRWIHFHGISMPEIYEKYLERGGAPVFTPEDFDAFLKIWSTLFATAISSDYIRDMRINEGLAVLLTLIMKNSWQKLCVEKRKGFDIHPVKQYLDENFTQKITLDNLAERFYINKYSLAREYHNTYDISIIAYVNQLRISSAKRMLRFSQKSITQIATDCGFESLYYFSRIFKQIEGISPSQYRDKW